MKDVLRGGLVELHDGRAKLGLAGRHIAGGDGGANLLDLSPQGRTHHTVAGTAVNALAEAFVGAR
jgi:hypothetical protein